MENILVLFKATKRYEQQCLQRKAAGDRFQGWSVINKPRSDNNDDRGDINVEVYSYEKMEKGLQEEQ